MRLNLSNRHYPTIFLLGLISAAAHLTLFSFRPTEDTPCWFGVVDYFRSGFNLPVTGHCLYNPLIPFITLLINSITGLGYIYAYFSINIFAYFLTALIVYRFSHIFFSKHISLLASLFFLLSFTTQILSFSVVPDIFTWSLEAVFIYAIFKRLIAKGSVNSGWIMILGLFSALLVLTKINLGFLLPSALVLFYLKSPRNFIKHSLIFVIFVSIPILAYYFWIYQHTGIQPWDSLIIGLETEKPTVISHLTAFVAAFLYFWPLILASFPLPKFSQPQKILLFSIALGLLVPIIIWPYVGFRFAYSFFIFFLPLAALGTHCLTTRTKSYSNTILISIIAVYWAINLLRVHLTLTNQTHIVYFLHLINRFF